MKRELRRPRYLVRFARNTMFAAAFLLCLLCDVAFGGLSPTCTEGDGRCVSDCTNERNGDYQSCQGCEVYVTCSSGRIYDLRPCPAGLVWDDKVKRCEWESTTCIAKGAASTMYITCDDIVEGLFLDGKNYTVPGARHWELVGNVSVPAGTRVVAIQCWDVFIAYGVLVTTTTGLITDTNWKCTHVYEKDWMLPDFDDSHWPKARVTGDPINGRWKMKNPHISPDARYIWSPNVRQRVYCRSPYK